MRSIRTTLLMAQTIDGKIGKGVAHYTDWTGREDKRLFVRVSREAGVVIMGSKTFDTLKAPLPGRKNVVITRQPHRKSDWDNVVFTNQTPEAILADLERQGYAQAIIAGGAVINTLFAVRGLIDEIILSICPIVFGRGISLFVEDMEMKLRLLEVQRANGDLVVLKYRVMS